MKSQIPTCALLLLLAGCYIPSDRASRYTIPEDQGGIEISVEPYLDLSAYELDRVEAIRPVGTERNLLVFSGYRKAALYDASLQKVVALHQARQIEPVPETVRPGAYLHFFMHGTNVSKVGFLRGEITWSKFGYDPPQMIYCADVSGRLRWIRILETGNAPLTTSGSLVASDRKTGRLYIGTRKGLAVFDADGGKRAQIGNLDIEHVDVENGAVLVAQALGGGGFRTKRYRLAQLNSDLETTAEFDVKGRLTWLRLLNWPEPGTVLAHHYGLGCLRIYDRRGAVLRQLGVAQVGNFDFEVVRNARGEEYLLILCNLRVGQSRVLALNQDLKLVAAGNTEKGPFAKGLFYEGDGSMLVIRNKDQLMRLKVSAPGLDLRKP